jgi:hypothetical protein
MLWHMREVCAPDDACLYAEAEFAKGPFIDQVTKFFIAPGLSAIIELRRG